MIAIHERFRVRAITPFNEFSINDVKFEQDKEHCIIRIGDVSMDITIAIDEAIVMFNEQNARAREMEKQYNRHEGRYVVKDLSLYGIHYKDNRVRLEYIWVDCYGTPRVMYSPWFDVEKDCNNTLLLWRDKGYEFYF